MSPHDNFTGADTPAPGESRIAGPAPSRWSSPSMSSSRESQGRPNVPRDGPISTRFRRAGTGQRDEQPNARRWGVIGLAGHLGLWRDARRDGRVVADRDVPAQRPAPRCPLAPTVREALAVPPLRVVDSVRETVSPRRGCGALLERGAEWGEGGRRVVEYVEKRVAEIGLELVDGQVPPDAPTDRGSGFEGRCSPVGGQRRNESVSVSVGDVASVEMKHGRDPSASPATWAQDESG